MASSPTVLCPAVLVLVASVAGQGLRIDRHVERPLVYVAQRAPAPGGEDVVSTLRDEALRTLLGGSGGQPGGADAAAGDGMLASLQRLLTRLSRFSDQSEMALLRTVRDGDRLKPVLVFHTFLREDGAAEMRRWLESGDVAERSRQLHERQVYRFKPGSGSAALSGAEVALVDRDLVVSNDRRTLGRMLDPRTAASGGFAEDERYTRLRKRVEVPPGSLMVYADWRALRPGLHRVFRGDATWLMSLSGIESPEQLMFVARPAPRKSGQKPGVITTIALHHASPTQRPSTVDTATQWHPDGWLDLVEPARAQTLVAGLPEGGVISFAAMFDLHRVLPTHRSMRMRQLQAAIFRACRRTGIDLRREVLRRLSRAGGAQLLLLEGPGEGLRLAWSMQANNVGDAKELFRVFQRMFVPAGAAELVQVAGGQHELRFAHNIADGLVLTRAHDSLVVAFSPDVTEQVRKMAAARRRTSNYNRTSAALMSQLQRLGIGRQEQIYGVFGLDLGFLDADKAGKSRDRTSGLLGLHGGVIEFEKDLVRLTVFSELDL